MLKERYEYVIKCSGIIGVVLFGFSVLITVMCNITNQDELMPLAAILMFVGYFSFVVCAHDIKMLERLPEEEKVSTKSPSIFYDGVPIDEVDFEAEYNKELSNLLAQTSKLAKKQSEKGSNFNYRYWTIKLNKANKALEESQITLD